MSRRARLIRERDHLGQGGLGRYLIRGLRPPIDAPASTIKSGGRALQHAHLLSDNDGDQDRYERVLPGAFSMNKKNIGVLSVGFQRGGVAQVPDRSRRSTEKSSFRSGLGAYMKGANQRRLAEILGVSTRHIRNLEGEGRWRVSHA